MMMMIMMTAHACCEVQLLATCFLFFFLFFSFQRFTQITQAYKLLAFNNSQEMTVVCILT